MEKGFLCKEEISAEDLSLINLHTKRSLTAEELYVFSVVLCDNDIDRDFERFTPEALQKLAELYVGKTGIFDHSMKGRDQIARIFSTTVEKTDETTADGMPYYRLKAKAYLPRTPKTEEFILRLEAGINKEVSVGCQVAHKICSICGADTKQEYCGHQKGQIYGEGLNAKQCYLSLSEPLDAYEWSFVAVPAQPKAGVVKAMGSNEGVNSINTNEILKSLALGGITLSDEQAKNLHTEILNLQAIKKDYVDGLRAEAVKKCSKALPDLKGEELQNILDALGTRELKSFISALDSKVSRAEVQLVSEKSRDNKQNNLFKI